MPSSHPILCHPLLLLLFPTSFPPSGSFQMSQLFTSGGHNIGVSASTSGWISLQSKGPSRVFTSTTVQKHQIFGAQLSFIVQLSHPYMTAGKNMALTRQTFVGKVMSLLLNMPSRLVITFLARSKQLLISWLQSPSAEIREFQTIKSSTVSIVSHLAIK